MSSSLRAVRATQSFAPTAPRLPSVRKLHITGANAQPSTYLSFQTRMSELEKNKRPAPKPASRPFNTARALQKPNDSSPIDMVYMPSIPAEDTPINDIGLIPIVPDNTSTSYKNDPILIDSTPVQKPEITTSSLASPDVVLAMGEAETSKAADGIGLVETVKEEVGTARKMWTGFVDDLLGPKKVAI